MAATAGRDCDFDFGGTNLSNYLNVANWSQTANKVEVTGFSDDWHEWITALKEGGLDLTGWWDSTIDGILQTAFGTSTTFFYGPAGSTGTYVKISGSLMLESYDITPNLDGRIEWSGHFVSTGTVSIGTY